MNARVWTQSAAFLLVLPLVSDEPAAKEAKADAKSPWVALDISSACNADVISTDAHKAADFFNPYNEISWKTTRAKQAEGEDGKGLPDDGKIAIPHGNPKDQFQVRVGTEKNAILLTARDDRYPNAVKFELPEAQRGKFA